MEGFQFFALTDRKTLAHGYKRRYYGICRSQFLGDPGTEMGSLYRLWWFITSMPMVLVPCVQDVAKVCRFVGTDDSPVVHYISNGLQPFGKIESVDNGRYFGKSTQYPLALDPFFKRGIGLGVECFGMGHTSRHPEQNYRIGRGWYFGHRF